MKYDKYNENDEYYTPPEVFKALGVKFDLDVAAPVDRKYCHVPADKFITENSLDLEWNGFVWLNPPYSGRNSKAIWLDKLYEHGHGIALVPDRTNSFWWQEASVKCDLFMFTYEKIKFITSDGTIAKQPGTNNTLFAYGDLAVEALLLAEEKDFGITFKKYNP